MASPNHVKAGYWYCDSKFPTPVASIPSQHFTHLFAAFADVKASTYEVTFPVAYQVQFSTFTQTVQKRNENVQTLLSIGGGVSSPSTFASLASQPSNRKSFINSSISLARSNNFHGLSLHWLYPSSSEEMTNLASLLKEWRKAVDLEAKWTGNDPLLLVAAVYDKPKYRTVDYPVGDIKSNLNWINVLAYDYHSPSSSRSVTQPFAALYNEQDKANCGDTGVNAWLDALVPAKKIVLGLPFYGYAWHLNDVTQNGISARADGPAKGVPAEGVVAGGLAGGPAGGPADGVYSKSSDGTIFYNQIKHFIEIHQPNVQTKYEAAYVIDYCSAGNTWIGYNDTGSIIGKVEYAKRKKELLGYYAWHVGCDKNGTLSTAASEEWDRP